jgi:glycosyltransferase involved in cell wall biosynthesis
MTISIIVPTFNGEKKIIGLLRSLEEQTYKDFDVIVVIDGSTDNTENILIQNQFKLKAIKILKQPNKGRAAARNAGAAIVDSDILLFLDDDMRLTAEGVEKHLLLHQQNLNQNLIIVGNTTEDLSLLKSDIQKYKYFKSKLWERATPQHIPMTKDNFFLAAAHFSIPKQLFFELCGFDEKLRDAEDFDLAKRALDKGMQIIFKPNIVAWHDDFITCRRYIFRQQEYNKAHQNLKNLYPERYQQNPYTYEPVNGIKKIVYWFFSGYFWVNVVDKYNFLCILPKNIRYKLYDVIITANAVHFPLKMK